MPELSILRLRMLLQPSLDPDWLHGHAHEPNPIVPVDDPTLYITLSGIDAQPIGLAQLQSLPCTKIEACMIISTGHGTSGPFDFAGVRLLTLLESILPPGEPWTQVDIHSADNFGTRIRRDELQIEDPQRPALLAYQIDGQPLTRTRGLVRLIVPSEVDDALRQVKWVARIEVKLGF